MVWEWECLHQLLRLLTVELHNPSGIRVSMSMSMSISYLFRSLLKLKKRRKVTYTASLSVSTYLKLVAGSTN